jgi:hypothetical protein
VVAAATTKMNYITGDTSYKKEIRIHVTLNWGGNVTQPEVLDQFKHYIWQVTQLCLQSREKRQPSK